MTHYKVLYILVITLLLLGCTENNYYPCWKKTNGWNLHYIWKRQF